MRHRSSEAPYRTWTRRRSKTCSRWPASEVSMWTPFRPSDCSATGVWSGTPTVEPISPWPESCCWAGSPCSFSRLPTYRPSPFSAATFPSNRWTKSGSRAPWRKSCAPAEAFREALVNALAHRDYTISAPVRVIVFEDRVEIRTPGRLPNTVTIDSLRSGVHVLRNPAIYNMFLKMGLVTNTGSGIPRMVRLVREATSCDVDLHLEGNEFVVVFPRPQKEK